MELVHQAYNRTDMAQALRFQGRAIKQHDILTQLEQALRSGPNWRKNLTSTLTKLNWDSSTIRRYGVWIEDFLSQTAAHLLPSDQIVTVTLEYIAGLVGQGQLSGALQALAALAFFWREQANIDLWVNSRVKAFHGGLRKVSHLLKPPKSKRSLLSPSAITRWLLHPPSRISSYDLILTATIISVGIRCIRRAGELSELNENHLEPRNRNGIIGAAIIVAYSKTDTSGESHCIEIEPGSSFSCPIYLLNRYLISKGSSLLQWKGRSGIPLFTTQAGSRLTTARIKNMVRAVAENAGLTGNFGSHSIRISGACLAILGGMSLEQVMAIGAWKSRAVEDYLRSLVAVASNATQRMGL